jgi:hypothetical protein
MNDDLPQDGIEIHFDDKRGFLELACEPDAFRQYLDLARRDMEPFPEIDVGRVIELHITDTATFVARRDAPRRRLWDVVFGVSIMGMVVLAAFGGYVLITRLLGL